MIYNQVNFSKELKHNKSGRVITTDLMATKWIIINNKEEKLPSINIQVTIFPQ